MDDFFERYSWDDSSKEQKGIYYFQSDKDLPVSIQEAIEFLDQINPAVEIEDIAENKKWKSYLNKDQFLVLNDNEKLVWSNGNETHTGTWEFMNHSSLLLLNFIQPDKVRHLVYQVLHNSEELLVLKPQHSRDEKSASYEVYYYSRKPSQKRILELLTSEEHLPNKDWLIYLTAGILLFLLVLYFMLIY